MAKILGGDDPLVEMLGSRDRLGWSVPPSKDGVPLRSTSEVRASLNEQLWSGPGAPSLMDFREVATSSIVIGGVEVSLSLKVGPVKGIDSVSNKSFQYGYWLSRGS